MDHHLSSLAALAALAARAALARLSRARAPTRADDSMRRSSSWAFSFCVKEFGDRSHISVFSGLIMTCHHSTLRWCHRCDAQAEEAGSPPLCVDEASFTPVRRCDGAGSM